MNIDADRFDQDVVQKVLEPFEEILRQYGLKRDDSLKFISEAEHLHSTDDVYHEQFQEILYRLGIDH